jgi:hypothetical protein
MTQPDEWSMAKDATLGCRGRACPPRGHREKVAFLRDPSPPQYKGYLDSKCRLLLRLAMNDV